MLKMDHKFYNVRILAYLDSMHISHQFAPPHEHEYIGIRIERNNCTTHDKLSCPLISSTKSKSLWLHALVMLSSNSILFPVNINHEVNAIGFGTSTLTSGSRSPALFVLYHR